MKKLLKLHDHKHTAKKLEHKHTSYRALFVIIFIFVGVMFMLQRVVSAENIVVTASINAPIPTIPSQITGLSNNFTTSEPLLNVSGTCQILVPATIVQINNNGQVVGSAPCDTSGNFNLAITLVNGPNLLIVKTTNVTNNFGPDSGALTVFYNPPTVPVITPIDNPTNINAVPANSREDTAVPDITAGPFIVYNPSKEFTWTITLSGGETPYTVTIDWGDGTAETFTNLPAGKLELSHKYSGTKKYEVIVGVTDVLGVKTVQSFVAVTLVQQNLQTLLGKIDSENPSVYQFSDQNIAVITGSSVLLVGSLWALARFEHISVLQEIRNIRFKFWK